jgi:hypothetical protein
MNGTICQSTDRIDNKVVVVTGSNTGIGKETVEDLLKRGMPGKTMNENLPLLQLLYCSLIIL